MSTDNLPETNEGYGTREYWEKRYAAEPEGYHFDWILKPDYLLGLVRDITGGQTDVRILMLGCGNSLLSEVLYDAGYTQIVNIDYSAVVIQQMKERHAQARPAMTWLEMDVTDLQFGEEFDVVIDKATMDAMLTTKGDPWNPPEKDVVNATKEVDEGLRVLRKRQGSKFIYWTWFAGPFRRRYFENREGWKFSTREVGPPQGFDYYQYMLEYEGTVA
ncbi:hypothetical protein CspeluHIS016_0406750 [Cutaneotrichosporon spelunceum]|uniref:Methyltransferase domain-containing protein n=1 Tax=Cutaneotrichosporon spelunceum TaxID=1672016 RepID=A0AAD3TWF9_9TREE|nr:hypothetical protein CspeluHIS016_0406750 [Cutaneotrichosporon spelunceum]